MPTTKHPPRPQDTLLIFPSDLGWMAAVVAGGTVRQLTFGHGSAAAARRAVGCVKRTTATCLSYATVRSRTLRPAKPRACKHAPYGWCGVSRRSPPESPTRWATSASTPAN